MPLSVPDLRNVKFGPFELDPSAARLLKSGIALKLQPQHFRVLLLLTHRAGEVVTRDEIKSHLWGDATYVDFERGINFAINQIRGVLCDDAEKPRYIETLPRKGYRFIASIEYTPADEPYTDRSLFEQSKPIFVKAGGVVIVLAISVVLWLVIMKVFWPHADRSITVAALPFQNSSGDKDIDFLRFALPDEIETALSSAPSVSIRPSNMTAKYVGQEVDLQKAGHEMRVVKIVTGHYLKEADKLRVVLEAVDVESNRVIWRENLTSSTPDMIGMREEIAHRVRFGLLPVLGISVTSETVTHPHNEKAYDSYLRSIQVPHNPGVNQDAIDLLESSVKADPDFAPSWEALGLRYTYEAAYGNGGEQMTKKAEEAYENALGLEPNRILAAGQLITTWVERRDPAKAYAFAKDLVAKHPKSAQAHFVLSYVYRYAGMLRKSAEECDRALALDSGNYSFRSCAWTFTELGRTDRARDFFRLDAGSDMAAYGEATALLDEGKLTEAREVVKKIPSNPKHFRDLLGACLEIQPASDLDHFAQQVEESLNAHTDGEALYFQGAILAFCGKHEPAARLLAGAVSANYCAYEALQMDPLLAKFQKADEYSHLLPLAAQCQQRFMAASQ